MSLENEIMRAVGGAVSGALKKGRDNWRMHPSLHQAAVLTGETVRRSGSTVSGELSFEEQRRQFPMRSRDAYGVAGGMRVVKTMRVPGTADRQTLMQKTGEALVSGFRDSLDQRL